MKGAVSVTKNFLSREECQNIINSLDNLTNGN